MGEEFFLLIILFIHLCIHLFFTALSIREKDASARKLNVIAYIMEALADHIMRHIGPDDMKRFEKEKKKRRRERKKQKKAQKKHVHEEL